MNRTKRSAFAVCVLSVVAFGAVLADPIVNFDEDDSYPNFSDIWCWVSLSHPTAATYSKVPPMYAYAEVPYQCQHKGSATPSVAVTGGPKTFTVWGKLRTLNVSSSVVTSVDEDDLPITFNNGDTAQKSTAIFSTTPTGGNVIQGQGSYQALGSTMLFGPGSSVPDIECLVQNSYTVQ